jgi:hypothetical protein
MAPEGWEAFYRSEWQGVWALLVAPALFLLYAAGPGRARAEASPLERAWFVLAYCVVFAWATLVDPIATGPLGRWLGLPEAARSGVMFAFVWLGDFRVFALIFPLAGLPKPWRRAVAWTFVVPALDLVLHFGILRSAWPGIPDQVLWLVHELAFLLLALVLRNVLVPRWATAQPDGQRRFLRRALAYVASYYGLWALCDLLILAGIDIGWGLRAIPNQLYYALWVPFVFFGFFASPPGPRARPSG